MCTKLSVIALCERFLPPIGSTSVPIELDWDARGKFGAGGQRVTDADLGLTAPARYRHRRGEAYLTG